MERLLSNKERVLGIGVPQSTPISLDVDFFEGSIVYGDDGILYYSDGANWFSISGANNAPTLQQVTNSGNITTNDITINATLNVSNTSIQSNETSVSSITETVIAEIDLSSYTSGKFIIEAHNTVSGERHITEMLVVHNGTTAVATEYATIYTGITGLASFNVDVNAGNVRILATGSSADQTIYKVLKQLVVG